MAQFSNKNIPKYDLEERTAKFAEDIIGFVRTLKQDAVNRRIIEQLVGSSGSIGANYSEAVEAESKKDFVHKISISKKEIKETKHWLRLLAKANPDYKSEIRKFWKEAHELLLIFAKIVRSSVSGRAKSLEKNFRHIVPPHLMQRTNTALCIRQ